METGIEPVCTALQAVASPLGHSTAGLMPLHPRADDGIRTRDPHLGKVMRYQLRYIRAPRARSSPVAMQNDSPGSWAYTNPLLARRAAVQNSWYACREITKPWPSELAQRMPDGSLVQLIPPAARTWP